MLSAYEHVELLVAGLRNAPPDPDRPPMLSITEADRFAWAGYQGFDIPDASEGVKVGDMAIAPGDAADFALGRWAATGDTDWMDELIRQAKHRDGTSHSIACSGYAMQILAAAVEVDPDFDKLLRSRGYNAGAIKFGAFPPGSSAVPVPVPLSRVLDAEINAPAVPVVGTAGPALAVMSVDSGTKDGAVIFVLQGQTFTLSITDARGAAVALERSIRALLLPGEGYRWDDSATLTNSALVVFDSELVKEFEPFTMLNLASGPDPEGRFVLGMVTMESNGQFIGEVFTKQPRKERRGDMNDAKFHVAQRVRDLLADPAARLAAAVAP